ncbi:NADH-quinone oxidoreductase subunit NuoG [Cognaticolwellia beringensis]|uniref:NADH-quinone oxidoreductase subunit G n=1 Tax=Cognaticolwellia beringensis TaxID=1967665 RepID=A0A222G5V2_9GAMM|nr:NADH-quinone oxidoreductase subunit NuoG [Cognaticolwellia beringensis]ASP46724.1 NADH-quinone oxidoreductase subunit G [Cognaticolwellia beringensis]
MSEKKVTIFIDDLPYQLNTEDNLLAGVLSKKLNLPYFCWHPSMGSVGACRQCAVTQFQDEDDKRGRLVMACITPVTDGMRISIKHKEASEFREQVIAAMMTNHPHDCPVCAEGGECHLQDMTVMTGHSVREYQGTKRTFNNQYLGELVGHEMNRCITCYRCTRFYNDYAGGKDFGVYGSKNQVYFGRQSDGALESEFSGNLVEVCPTGVFTNKVFSSHYTRKWDLQSAPSVCSHCSVGCNLSIGERYGSVRRVMNRYNGDINGYFICDRGRFGIGFVNGEQRINQAKGIAQQSPVSLTKLDVAKAFSHFRKKQFIGIGSARASLEANFYLKNIVGAEQFSPGYNDQEMKVAAQHAQLLASNKAPSLADIENSDFIFVIAEDISQTAPRMALAVRQALRNAAIDKAANIGIPSWQDSAVRTIGGKLLSPLFSLQSTSTKLDDVSEQALLLPVEQISKCLASLDKLLKFGKVQSINNDKAVEEAISDLAEQDQLSTREQGFIVCVYKALRKAKKPLFISGTSSVCAEILNNIANLISAFKQQNEMVAPALVIVPPCSNSVGLLSILDEQSLSIEQVLAQLNDPDKNYQGLMLLEQELEKLSAHQIAQLRKSAKTLIVLDHSAHRLSSIADIVLPVAAVTEGDGHYVNYQGRAQQFIQVHAPVLPIQESWRWLDNIADIIGIKVPKTSTEASGLKPHQSVQVVAKNNDCESLTQLHQFFTDTYTQWPMLIAEESIKPQQKPIARMSHRASGRTAQMANITVHEAKTTQKIDDNFTFSMEGKSVGQSSDMPFAWAPGWNSNQAIAQFQTEINGQLLKQKAAVFIAISTGIANNPTWRLSENSEDSPANNLAANLLTYVQQKHVYFSEWQAALTPEFQMLRQSNQIYINAETAQQAGVKKGQWCKVIFSATNEKMQLASQSVIGQVFIVNDLPSSLAFGNFSLCQPLTQQVEMSISLACDQEVTDYLAQFNDGLIAAKQSKGNILERLKVKDQTIPIRLFSGGLNDG